MRPPLLSVCRHRRASHSAQKRRAIEITQTVSRQASSCRLPEPIDLERNSADAIAPAMTSSALLSHHRAVGTLIQTPRALAGRTTLRIALKPTWRNQLRAQLPAAAVTSAASVFGGGTLPSAPIGVPGITTWKRRVLPSSCGCQERNTTYCILLRYLANRKSNPTIRYLDSRPAAWRVQCPFSVQRSESV